MGAIGIIRKLRPDICKGRIFACGASGLGGGEAWIEATPPTLALGRNPDRPWITEKLAISDLLSIDHYFDTSEVYPVELPTVEDLPRRIITLKKKSPPTKAMLAKRDINPPPV